MTESGAPFVMIISAVLTPVLCVASLATGNSYVVHTSQYKYILVN